ncbi:DUF2550 domain-containing protein [Actinomycetospora termitidis]|uniref:DUF2550 domain-containing protein n=1 Tax=Actinomycetospora termitidis TaxID=3053470 RepID=A0ABT7MAL6_9PSEU|nr:DUF2550 domain-containing protein [Actinomycetospora sp. Odt1-22]MDL5157077.1 DUF2550 domain-containing protein [Actinomycetospora sp. Odt1-22]
MTTAGMWVEIVLVVVAAVLLLVALVALRRLQQLRRGGVDVALRSALPADAESAADDQRGWHSGIARYRGDQFRWYRVSGLRSGPNVVLDRFDVEITDRRPPRPTELHTPGSTVLRCRTSEGTFELAMGGDVLTGFSSWLESTPPGRSTGYRQAS